MGYKRAMTLHRELNFALDLAKNCGAIALDYQRQGRSALEIRDKGADQGLVTRADTELNARIVAALREAFPSDVVVAEERRASSTLSVKRPAAAGSSIRSTGPRNIPASRARGRSTSASSSTARPPSASSMSRRAAASPGG